MRISGLTLSIIYSELSMIKNDKESAVDNFSGNAPDTFYGDLCFSGLELDNRDLQCLWNIP